MFKKGDYVVKILRCAGLETATICLVAQKKGKLVRLDHESHFRFDAETGDEVDPAMFGVSVRLIRIEENDPSVRSA